MFAQETYINKTRNGRIGESPLYETFTDDIGKLFRAFQQEHGRCRSKVYIDTNNGPKQIGWVFEKRVRYADCNETYLQETWVSLHTEEPTKTITYHYHYLD